MPLDPERLLGAKIPPRRKAYEDREPMLYALSVGARPDELRYVFERDLDVLPSFAQMVGFDDGWLEPCGVALEHVVHGSLDIAFDGVFAASGEADVETCIVGLTDKGAGRGGIIHQETRMAQAGATVATSLSSLFVRGGGGFGGDRGRQPEASAAPAREPDDTALVGTAANQAALFRLLGDRNPLHVDPEVARRAGFAGPILHGASTFGLACLTVLRDFCGGDPERLARFAARFTGPVYPGEALLFSFWREGETLRFRADASERGAAVLDSGLAVRR